MNAAFKNETPSGCNHSGRGIPLGVLWRNGSNCTPEPAKNQVLDAALRLARQGKPVFPCKPDKTPYVAGGFKSATTDPARIAEWWNQWPDALIGMPTGEASGVMVLDIDLPSGPDSLAALETEHGPLPATRGVRTRSGGEHRYLRHVPGVRNSAGKLGPGLDIRGDGGYVVAPGSPGYVWIDEIEPAEAPNWLVEISTKPKNGMLAQSPPVTFSGGDGSRYGLAAIRGMVDEMQAAPEGQRNHTLNRLAFRAGQLVAGGEISESAAETLKDAALQTGLNVSEVNQTFASGFSQGLQSPATAPPQQGGQRRAASPVSSTAGEQAVVEEGKAAPRSVSVSTIMTTEYKPIRWAVEKIIPEGLTVLAGAPKFGKSWLMLALCYAVATGTLAWGYGKTKRGTAIYLALEDSERRIKDRILSMEGYFDTFPDNIHIFTTFPRLGQGFAEEINRLLEIDGNVGVIIIDTLQKIRPLSGGGKRNLYQAEYEDFEMLQKLAINSGVPIIAVHHTRKRTSKAEPASPLDEISGSSGIQGVADTLIVCFRNGDKASMFVIGREVNQETYPLRWARLTNTWEMSAPESKQIDTGPMLLTDWFKSHDDITGREAAEQFGVSLRTAKRKLRELVDEGKLVANASGNPKDPHRYSPAEIF